MGPILQKIKLGISFRSSSENQTQLWSSFYLPDQNQWLSAG